MAVCQTCWIQLEQEREARTNLPPQLLLYSLSWALMYVGWLLQRASQSALGGMEDTRKL